MYKLRQLFGAVTNPFLSHVFSLLVLILTGSPGFKVDSWFWVSGSIADLVVEGLSYCLTEGALVQTGWLKNLWAGDSPFSSGWEFKNNIDE